jgi:hypothetical protein
MTALPALVRYAIKRYPAVLPLLKGRARWMAIPEGAYKTYEYFLAQLTRAVRNVYRGNLGGEFIDIMASLIQGQINQAYRQAWKDSEMAGEYPDYLQSAADVMILGQYDYVDQFYRDIVDARTDGTPIDPLLSRCEQWAGQYDTAYRDAELKINLENGGNLIWRKGETEHGCDTCASLNGIVMSAREWEMLDVHPRGYPNPKLQCEGGGPANNCDCTLEPTDQRRSPKAFDYVMGVTLK